MALSIEKKVGIFFVFGIIILGVMLELGGKWNPFDKSVPYKTYLTSVTGLKNGDSVRLAGVDVGRITGIRVLDGKVRIDFEVNRGTSIRSDSVASLRMTNLLGGQFLGISFGSSTAPLLPPGATVPGKDAANVDTVMSNLGDLAADAKSLVTDLNRMITGWANYFSLGSVSKAYRIVDSHVGHRLRMWLHSKHKVRCIGKQRFVDAATASWLGLICLQGRKGSLPWATA